MTPTHARLTHTLLGLTLVTLLVMGLPACSKKDDATVATQVAAKVGSEEITVYQINQALQQAHADSTSAEAAKALSREALEKLIDQQLAMTQAMEAKLHRSPEVIAQIEAAKRDILARAYLQHIASALPKPTAEEIKTYYAAHPELFAERRIFNLQEIVIPDQPDAASQLRSYATSGRAAEDIAGDLKAKGINFNQGAAIRSAEQIPLDVLSKLHQLKDGQSTVIESPQSATYLHLVSSQTAPISETAAMPRINQFLSNQHATAAVAANIQQLRATTTITYRGEFAKTDTQASLEKGVAGLK
ncbi:MAG TPA: EpsD family peptidyl-prolyl cis-trans isomerase [Rhodoferax sp.]